MSIEVSHNKTALAECGIIGIQFWCVYLWWNGLRPNR